MFTGETMFGHPQWFVEKRIGWGLTPVRWQGWVYTLAWCLVIAAPFTILVARHLVPEAVVWMTVTIAVLLWDVRQILRAMHRTASGADVLYIGDDEPVATRNYDLHRPR